MSRIDPRAEYLVQQVLQLCIKTDCIGFAGTFRTKDGFETFHLEAPGFTDGACRTIKEAIEDVMRAHGQNCTKIFDGLMLPLPGTDEMPT